MSRKISSFQERLNNRRSSSFVGRRQELETFNSNLGLDPSDENYFFIINIFGQGGVGKSTLLQKFKRLAEDKQMLVLYTNETIKDTLEFMEEIARQLTALGFSLKNFEERYKVFLEEKEKLEKSPEAPRGGFWSLLSRTGTKIGLHYLKKAIGDEAIGEIVDSQSVSAQASEWMDYIHKRVTNKDERKLILEPEEVLTPLFISDLNKLCEDRRLCWLIDTYEETYQFLDEWLRAILEGKYGVSEENLIFFVIAGREELRPEMWSSFAEVTKKCCVEPFSEAEARLFLNERGIYNSQTVEDIIEISMCLPVLLAMLADMAPSNAEFNVDISGAAVKRFLKWINDPVLERVALNGSLPRQLNQDVLSVLLDEDGKAANHFAWLKEKPFVHKRGHFWAYHNVVRELMATLQFETSQKNWSELHERLSNFYEEQAGKLDIVESELQWKDKKWENLKLESIYHQLCANYKKNLPTAIDSFVSILRLREPSDTLAWSTTILHAGKVWGETSWGEELQKGIQLMMMNEEDLALNMFANLSSSGFLSNDNLAFCLYKEGFILSHSDLKRSETQLEKAVEIKPDFHIAYNTLGVTYYWQNKTNEAINMYRKALEFDPCFAKPHNNIGVIKKEEQNYDEAIACFQKAVECNPQYVNAINNLAQTYQLKGMPEEAIEKYKLAIKTDPEYFSGYFNLISALEKQGRKSEADEIFERVKEFDIKDSNQLNNIGVILTNQNQVNEAIGYFEKSVEINRNMVVAWSNLGILHIKQNRYEKAEFYFREALALSPQSTQTKYYFGMTLFYQGKHNDAIQYLLEYEQENPTDIDVQNNLGFNYFLTQQYEMAIQYLEKSLALDPDYRSALYNLSYTYCRLGDMKKFVEYHSKAEQKDPDLASAWADMASTYSKYGKLKESTDCLKEAVAINPENASIHETMGWASLQLHDYPTAELHLLEAWKLSNYESPISSGNLGHLYFLSGSKEKSAHFYDLCRQKWLGNSSLHAALQEDHRILNMQEHGIPIEAFNEFLLKLKIE